jgi:hypothetical protein
MKADNLTVNCEPIFQKMKKPRRLANLLAYRACYRNTFNFTYIYLKFVHVWRRIIFIFAY